MDNALESGYAASFTIHRPEGDLVIDGIETWEGGNLESAGGKHRNGVTRRSTARGGLPERNALTVGWECDARMWALRPLIDDSVDRDRFTAIRHKVGPRGEVIGNPQTVTGIVGSPSWPNYDLDGGDNIGMVELESETDQ